MFIEPAGPGIMTEVRRVIDQRPAAAVLPSAEALGQSLREALGIELPAGEFKLERKGRRIEGGAIVERLEWRSSDGVSFAVSVPSAPTGRLSSKIRCGIAGSTWRNIRSDWFLQKCERYFPDPY